MKKVKTLISIPVFLFACTHSENTSIEKAQDKVEIDAPKEKKEQLD